MVRERLCTRSFLSSLAFFATPGGVGFGTEKRSGDCLIKALGDCGDVVVTLSLFNHPTITEVKDFVQKRMENIRENKAILEEVGIDQ